MGKQIEDILERAKSWPPEDQAALVSFADDIEAIRRGVYVLSKDEAAAVEEGLAQADRGEFAPDEEVKALWSRFGVE